jgi:hypothetical protein
MEKIFSKAVSDGLNLYRDLRDWAQESWFYTVFDNPLVKAMSAGGSAESQNTPQPQAGRSPRHTGPTASRQGGSQQSPVHCR